MGGLHIKDPTASVEIPKPGSRELGRLDAAKHPAGLRRGQRTASATRPYTTAVAIIAMFYLAKSDEPLECNAYLTRQHVLKMMLSDAPIIAA